MAVSKKYTLQWKQAKEVTDINKQLTATVQKIDEMFQALYINTLQAETGTWTPADQSTGGLTLADPTGQYVKLGNLVILMGYVKYPTTANAATAILSGLPYPPDVSGVLLDQGFFVSDETTVARLQINSSGFIQPLTTAAAAITNATLSTNYLYFTVIYRTTS